MPRQYSSYFNSFITLIRVEPQKITMIKTINNPDGSVFPLILQFSQCSKKIKALNLGNFNCLEYIIIVGINESGEVRSA